MHGVAKIGGRGWRSPGALREIVKHCSGWIGFGGRNKGRPKPKQATSKSGTSTVIATPFNTIPSIILKHGSVRVPPLPS